jgi:hypothetical protein
MNTDTFASITFNCSGCEFQTSDEFTVEVISAVTESCPLCGQAVFADEFHSA